MFGKMKRASLEFVSDESGESSVLSNVMMLAVAALAVVALIAFGKQGMAWLGQQWQKISGSSMEN